MTFVPKRIFFTRGVGRHKDYLSSFELALRDAKIETCNLVTVSSILPAGCQRVSVEEGAKAIVPGQITFAVLARNATNEPNRLIASSIGVAQPAEAGRYGYLSEHHPYGETEERAGDYAEDLAASMLASSLGIPFDPDSAWDEREKVFKMSGQIVETFAVTQSAVGDPNGLWTTVISAGVMLPE
ncbi:MAG: pyruvoyl-dependent arginine decarboxylase [Myxococcota bacterium]